MSTNIYAMRSMSLLLTSFIFGWVQLAKLLSLIVMQAAIGDPAAELNVYQSSNTSHELKIAALTEAISEPAHCQINAITL